MQFSGLGAAVYTRVYVSKADYPLREKEWESESEEATGKGGEREPFWIPGRDSSRLFSTSTGLIMAPRASVCLRNVALPYSLPTATDRSLLSFDWPANPGQDQDDPLISSIDRPDIRICFRERNVRRGVLVSLSTLAGWLFFNKP